MNPLEIKPKNQFSPVLFTHSPVIQHLHVIGLALIAVSVLYLIAANWLMLPKIIQLLIPQIFLLISASASVWLASNDAVRQALDGISGLMLGLSMAVIGQVYQTGADSYLLFLVWALLLLPWLYRPNIGVFALFCVVSQFALLMFFKQSFWMNQELSAYLLCLSIWTGLCFIACIQRYFSLRYVFTAFAAGISLLSMFKYCEHYAWPYLALSLPLAFSLYFYMQRMALETSLQVAGLAASVSILIFQITEDALPDSAAGLLVLAALIFAWFAGISAVLMKMLPKTKFAAIPLALGAWFAGIILSSLLLTYWKVFSIAAGLAFIAAARLVIRRTSSLFLRQLAYCLWICGQAAVLAHTELLTGSIALICLIQFFFAALCIFSRMHWLIVLMQLAVLYGLGLAALLDAAGYGNQAYLHFYIISLNYALLTLLLCSAPLWLKSAYRASFSLWILLILAAAAVLQLALNPSFQAEAPPSLWANYLLPGIWLLSFCLIHRRALLQPQLWAIPALAAALMLFGYFEIFILLALLAWSVAYQQRLVQALSILLLVFWLWLLYYSLGVSFLMKSLSIFLSGLAVMLLAHLLAQQNKTAVPGSAA
ncbi:DUF2157 domain-containing protein [Acinetobacter sp.]|uniref:DUF2157 domain-containing protein n=1 Tax=Acinetobacter sp. TaxID=472 RepID=UPI002FC9E236